MLTALQQVAIKSEATAGTAETLLAGNVILHRGDATWEPGVVVTPRDAMSGSGSPVGSVVGSRSATIRVQMYLRGTTGAPVAGSNEPDFSACLKACGLALTVSGGSPNEQSSFKPSAPWWSDQTSGPYSTIGGYRDGKLYKIHGAVGSRCVLTFEVGAPVLAEFEFVGVYNEPTDAVLLVPTYPAVVEPPFLSAAPSILGYTSARFKSLQVDLGIRTAMRPNPAGAAGFLSAQITGMSPTGTLDPEEVLAATKNWHGEFIAGTTGAITTGVFPSTGANYNQFQFTGARAKYKKVGLGDREGVMIAPLEVEFLANSDAGDDYVELVQT